MTMVIKHFSCQKGFTLLEIIVTLILVGISAAIMFPVMGTNLTRSAEPVNRVDDQYTLIQEMDRLIGIYREVVDEDTLEDNTPDFTLLSNFKSNQVDPISGSTSYYMLRNADAYVASGSDGTVPTRFLMVTLALGDQKVSAVFTE